MNINSLRVYYERVATRIGELVYNIGNRRLFYPSPGIDFEVSGVKLDGAGVNSRRGGVGSLCCCCCCCSCCCVVVTMIKGEYTMADQDRFLEGSILSVPIN